MCEKRRVLIALGTFDGLHLGHKKVLLSDTSEYDEKIALMFTEHPQKALSGDVPGELVTDKKRNQLLKEWGYTPEHLDFVAVSGLSPEEFVDKILIEKFNATALCCGFNYCFGKGAKGDVALLKKLCAEREIKLTVCNQVEYDGAPVSSTRIRECIKNGDIRTANKMLGRYFSYNFEVVHGDARGRTLGSPTINQFFSDNFTVADYGVYASFTVVDGKKYISVTNIGIRPTIKGGSEKRSETNIVGFDGDLYGQDIEVFLVEKLRGERAFNSLDELSESISADRKKSTEIIKKEFQNEF
ncbi:MAG: riboflavin biosynthesis protein RibF [Clostridia bacterium]|nr:riboflavin biosynthesis protein RibF [Clostridia bacterium]